ncbi:hypothetical protein NPIL_376751 [Nephila pilipes]|uniref:Uncharacterized protein n=1 Tax=Nephila pilipes TaxID=299642 RepID=A0A8X6PNX7_NEPPI|nr:hypothetical protein NPIL_376751 [Nephila pilipes]
MTEVNLVCEFILSDCWKTDPIQEEEPMDWEDVPTLLKVIPPSYPNRPTRKMRSLVSKVSEPPVSANRFPNMRALVPKLWRHFLLRRQNFGIQMYQTYELLPYLQLHVNEKLVYSVDERGCFRPPGGKETPRGLPCGQLSRDQCSRPPSGVPRATLYFEPMTAADGLQKES